MKVITSIIFYGRAKEISGNGCLVNDKGATIMMDFNAEAKDVSKYRKAQSSNILVKLFERVRIKRIDSSKPKILVPIHVEHEECHKKWCLNVKSIDLRYRDGV